MSHVKFENLLTEHELARMLKRSVKTIRKDRLFDRGPRFLKIGRLVRYRKTDVDAYLDACPTGGGCNLKPKRAR